MREAERRGPTAEWLAGALRAGHGAKGAIYAATAALGLWRALAGAGGTGGAREAVQAIARAPFGKLAIAILALGLAAFALSRLTLALFDAERGGWRTRALHVGAAALNTALVVFLVHLLFGGETAAADGPTRLARTLARPRGRWIVAAFGAGLFVRGSLRLVRPRRDEPADRMASLGLSRAATRWASGVASAARLARGTILLAVGGGLAYAAAVRAPAAGPPWVGGVVGCCLLLLAANEWTRARYPLLEAEGSDQRDEAAGSGQSDEAAVIPPAARTSPTRPAEPACTDRRRRPRSAPEDPAPSE